MRVEELVVLLQVRLDERRELLGALTAKGDERTSRGRCDEPPGRRLGRAQLGRGRVEVDAALRAGRVDDLEGVLAIGVDRGDISVPGGFADALDVDTGFALERVECRRVRDLLADDPLTHPADRIEFDLEPEAVL